MFDRSRYSAILHNEIKKVRKTTGLCCSSNVCCNDIEMKMEENKQLLAEVLIDNVCCNMVDLDTEIELRENTSVNATGQNNSSEQRTHNNINQINQNITNNAGQDSNNMGSRFRRCRQNCDVHSDQITKLSPLDEAEILDSLLDEADDRRNRRNNCCVSNRNNGNTNVYRFLNQNFPDNATGRCNVNISSPKDNTALRRAQIMHILRKYGVKNIIRDI